ncbi:MAG TPA: phosphotransferase family protein [Methylomirabilota bacterium]|jgi:aminoglycoside phosphotransferase (APT) family kinase protein|nr:phosphotransferase family protein [Methylomirabilota bacterium]
MIGHTPPGWTEPETVPVRPEATLDHEVVSRFLRGKLPQTEGPLEIVQFAGGHANLTYLVRFGEHEYVLRRPPSGPVAAGAYDMAREYRVLSALWRVFPPASRPYLFCDDVNVLGAPFFVMERRHGLVIHKDMPPAYWNRPDLYRRVSAALVDTLVELHAIDCQAIGLATLGKPEGFIERQVTNWLKRWARAQMFPMPLLDEVGHWLLTHLPRSQAPTLLHNDYKLDNIMVDPRDIAHIVALFDWDQCTVGDPLVDLGLLLNYWTQADDTPGRQSLAQAPTTLPGFYTRAELVHRYATQSGRNVEAIPFYETFALWKTAIVVMQLFVLYKNGQLQDERLAVFDQRVVALAEAAHEVVYNWTH